MSKEVKIVKDGDCLRFPMIEYDLNQPGGRPPYVRKKRPPARELVPIAEQPKPSFNPLDDDDSGEPSHAPRSGETSHAPNGDESSGESSHAPVGPTPVIVGPEPEPDFWSMTSDTIVRHHRNPRTKLYVPDPADFPILTKYIDVMRWTETDLDE